MYNQQGSEWSGNKILFCVFICGEDSCSVGTHMLYYISQLPCSSVGAKSLYLASGLQEGLADII